MTPHPIFACCSPRKLTFVCSRKIAAWKTWKKTVPLLKGSLRVNFRVGSRILVLVFPKIRATLPIPHEKIGTWMLQTSGGTSTRVMHHLYGILLKVSRKNASFSGRCAVTAHGISSFDHYKVDVLDGRHSMSMKLFPVKQHKLSGFSKELGNVIKPRAK